MPSVRLPALLTTGATLAWLALLAAIVAALSTVGDPVASAVAYLAVWLISTTIPGVLIWRALARPSTLVQEIGFGSVVGIGMLLLAWLPATLLHASLLMWLWPAGIIGLFASVPSLRSLWFPERTTTAHTPARWHAAMILVCGAAFTRLFVTSLRITPLPPHATSVFQDVWYELGLTQALTHSVAISDPQVAGVPLHYHWFSNADAAATGIMSGVPMPAVILHLWLVPMVLTLMFAVAAATERVLQGPANAPQLRHWWAGPIAAIFVGVLPLELFLSNPRFPGIDSGFVASSTSGVLALVVILALVGPVLDLLHGRNRPGTWVLLVILLALSAGTKPSILPVAACGSLLALIVQWVRTRRFVPSTLILVLLPLLIIPIASLAVIGSTGGSRLQLFETLSLDPAFVQAAGRAVNLPGHGGWLAPGLANGPTQAWPVGAGLFLLVLLIELPRLIGIAALTSAKVRQDIGVWWCGGVVGAGYCGLWVLAHPGYSQHYFWRIVIPLGIILTITSIVRTLPDRPDWIGPVVVAGVAGLGTSIVIYFHNQTPSDPVGQRLLPYVFAAIMLLIVVVFLRLLSVRGMTRLPAFVIMMIFVCAAASLPAAQDLYSPVHDTLTGRPLDRPLANRYVSSAEQRAALWLHNHSSPNDVIATNVFCSPPYYKKSCNHVAFWVSALIGRQLFIGASAYTEKSMAAYGHTAGVNYQKITAPWPNRVTLSLKAVRSPSTTVITDLKRQDVQWIFADRRATKVAPDLGRYATLRYRNTDVLIYELSKAKEIVARP